MPAPKRKRRLYSPTEIDKGLTLLVSSASSEKAAELAGIPARTLRDWKVEHFDRYLEIQEREAPKLEALAANQAREIMIRAGEKELDLLGYLGERLEDARRPAPDPNSYEDPDEYETAYKQWTHRTGTKELSDVAASFQKLATGKGINGTKLLELTGRPTSIVEHRDPRAEIRAMAREFGITIDSTAEELPTENRTLPPRIAGSNAREAVRSSHSTL